MESMEVVEEKEDVKEEKKPILTFRCFACKMEETYDYLGKNPPDSKYLTLVEESYVKKDPFSHPREKQFLVLGSNCSVCSQAVCQATECSIFYGKRYCQQCAAARKSSFPEQLRKKIQD